MILAFNMSCLSSGHSGEQYKARKLGSIPALGCGFAGSYFTKPRPGKRDGGRERARIIADPGPGLSMGFRVR